MLFLRGTISAIFASSLVLSFLIVFSAGDYPPFPMVINTWNFTDANQFAFDVLMYGSSAVDAVEAGCQTCEMLQCDGTVGYGGSPDERGETTLDALIMDGKTMNVGAVAALRNVKKAVSVARHILEYTEHSLLVGSQATRFAIEMGFTKESLSTNTSKTIWKNWRRNRCQPNFWVDVKPDPKKNCGPYKPVFSETFSKPRDLRSSSFNNNNHDTIGMVAIDAQRNIAVATSTNGARNKIPGRVGDSPIIGSGGYAENGIGGAAATGDGDILMRFLPSFKAVESLRAGMSVKEAAIASLTNIIKYYPKFVGAIVVVDANGNFDAACYGIEKFSYSVSQIYKYLIKVIETPCIHRNVTNAS